MAWSRFTERVEELVLRADPALAEEKRRAREAARQVVVSRTNAEGMKRLVIQGRAGEVVLSRGRIHQMALILQAQGASAPIARLEADPATLLLTDPGEALRLLLVAAADDADLAEDLRAIAVLDQLRALTGPREPGPREGGPASEDWTDPPRRPVPAPHGGSRGRPRRARPDRDRTTRPGHRTRPRRGRRRDCRVGAKGRGATTGLASGGDLCPRPAPARTAGSGGSSAGAATGRRSTGTAPSTTCAPRPVHPVWSPASSPGP